LHWVLFPTKSAQQNAALWLYTPQARSPFWPLKPAPEHAHAHARLLPRLSWSWTVLLPSDTHRNPTTSITAVLPPFVAHLLASIKWEISGWLWTVNCEGFRRKLYSLLRYLLSSYQTVSLPPITTYSKFIKHTSMHRAKRVGVKLKKQMKGDECR
jgi:hypothetical protein